MTRIEFLQGAKVIADITNKKMTDSQINTYFMLLKELTIEQFQGGLAKMFLEREYTNIPSPGEINKYCLGKSDMKEKAIIAKEKFKLATKKVSAYKTIAFDDPVIHKIIQGLGGWVKVVKMPLKELEDYIKFEFEKVYTSYCKIGVGEVPTMFIGIHDAQNSIQAPDVKLIGSEEIYTKWTSKYKEKVLCGKITAFSTELKSVNSLLLDNKS